MRKCFCHQPKVFIINYVDRLSSGQSPQVNIYIYIYIYILMSYEVLQNLEHFPVTKDKDKTSFAVTLFFAA